jgi:Polyketide cyclase / dehydrase and lipid transport
VLWRRHGSVPKKNKSDHLWSRGAEESAFLWLDLPSKVACRLAGRVDQQVPNQRRPNSVSTVRKSVEVDAPLKVVYSQWTQFESFPEFMDGVEAITQPDATSSHWVVKVGGVTRE